MRTADLKDGVVCLFSKKCSEALVPLKEKLDAICRKPVQSLDRDKCDIEVCRILFSETASESDKKRISEIVRKMEFSTINSVDLWKDGSLPFWLATKGCLDALRVLMERPDVGFWKLIEKKYGDPRSEERVLVDLVHNEELVRDILLYLKNNKYMNLKDKYGNPYKFGRP